MVLSKLVFDRLNYITRTAVVVIVFRVSGKMLCPLELRSKLRTSHPDLRDPVE